MKEYTAERILADDARDYAYQLNSYFNRGWEFVEKIETHRKQCIDTVVVLQRDRQRGKIV